MGRFIRWRGRKVGHGGGGRVGPLLFLEFWLPGQGAGCCAVELDQGLCCS